MPTPSRTHLALLAVGAALAVAPSVASARPRLLVSVEACHAAPAAHSRYVRFATQVTAIPGSTTISVRLDLFARTPADAALRLLSAPGLGVWRTSMPGVGVLRDTQAVSDLAAPGSYALLARVRWLDGRHRVIRTARRLSPLCYEAGQSGSTAPVI